MGEVNNKGSKKVSLVLIVNIAILIVYTLFFRLTYGHDYGSEYGFIIDAFFLAAHVLLCLIISIFTRTKEFILSAGLVLLIGFSTCVIGLS